MKIDELPEAENVVMEIERAACRYVRVGGAASEVREIDPAAIDVADLRRRLARDRLTVREVEYAIGEVATPFMPDVSDADGVDADVADKEAGA